MTTMIPTKAQSEDAEKLIEKLKEYRMAYLSGEERTGKTLTAVLAAEACPSPFVIVLTKPKAVSGWNDTLAKYPVKKHWTVTTYGKGHKVPAPNNFLLILDESHNNISGYPKPSSTFTKLRPLGTLASGVIHVSATPHAQGYQLLFHQFALHRFSPWKRFKNFYDWFRVYGIPSSIMIQGRLTPQYKKTDEAKVLPDIAKYFVTRTREELGFVEPEDKVHYVELGEATRFVYNELIEENVVELSVGLLVCDTVAKLRAALHMLEGGVCKIEDERFVLANTEKVDAILKDFGDTEDLVIMYHYKAELTKLQRYFKKATLLQGTSNAEGVDLSGFKHLVVYSQDWSTARHSQRRARQANLNRTDDITVHFYLVKKAISDQCYKTVSKNKRNFVDSVFERETL